MYIPMIRHPIIRNATTQPYDTKPGVLILGNPGAHPTGLNPRSGHKTQPKER